MREPAAPVKVQVVPLLAERQIHLPADNPAPEVLVRAATGQDHREARREGRAPSALHERLIPIMDLDVADTALAGEAGEGHGVRNLVSLPGEGPFLRERGVPVRSGTGKTKDVLDDATLLVERFLDQERVVEDLKRLGLARSRRRLSDCRPL